MDISNLSSASSLFVPCHGRSRARRKRMGTMEGLAAAPGFKRSSVKEASSTGSHMIDALTFARPLRRRDPQVLLQLETSFHKISAASS